MPGAPHIPLMAIRKIARMGHPVLQGVAKPVPDPTAPEVKALVRDMIETMIDANGAGLAAPQIYEPWRIVVFQAPPERAPWRVRNGFEHPQKNKIEFMLIFD